MALGSGIESRWLGMMSIVCPNHQPESWLSTWPLYGTRASTRSKADRRSVVTSSRRVSSTVYQSRTLPDCLPGRGRLVSASACGSTARMACGSCMATSELGSIAHYLLEEVQTQAASLAARPAGMLIRVEMIFRMRHQPQH